MISKLSRRHVLAFAASTALMGISRPSYAGQLKLPQGKPVLRIGGSITERNDGEEAVFDIPMLDALGTRSFATSTPWTDGVSTWDGVPLAVLMETVGASGNTIRATALNDYVTDVPMDGLTEEGGILAMRRDGELMPISDKGPLFILYPFDGNAHLQQQSVFMRCAWQVARLDII